MEEIYVTAAIMSREGTYLIARRSKGSLKGKWEFPGGQLEKEETLEECLARELQEEFKIEAKVRSFFGEGIWESGTKKVRLLAYYVEHISGEFQLSVHDEIKWVYPQEFDYYDFAPADTHITKKIQSRHSGSNSRR